MFGGIGYPLDIRALMITMTLKRMIMMMMFINIITMLIVINNHKQLFKRLK